METVNTENIRKIYVGAVVGFLNRCKEASYGTYAFVNGIIDKKYGSVEKYAEFISGKIDDRGILSTNEKILPGNEKQIIVTYWIFGRYASATEKNEKIVINGNGKKERLDFTGFVNEYHESVKRIFASKELEDERGRKFKGSDLFHTAEVVERGVEKIDESFLVTLLVSVAVYAVCSIASPYIAKKTPGLCSTIREFSENYPTISKIGSFLSPFDIDSFIEQDKINKGEVTDDGVDDGDEIIDDTEGDDDFEAVTQDELEGDGASVGGGDDDILPPGYEYVRTETYEYGHDYDEKGHYIGNKKSEQ